VGGGDGANASGGWGSGWGWDRSADADAGCGVGDIRPDPLSISLFAPWLLVVSSPDDELTIGPAGTDLSGRTGAAGRDSNRS
jgi:hypothetical protein